jgi:hypothetical protein
MIMIKVMTMAMMMYTMIMIMNVMLKMTFEKEESCTVYMTASGSSMIVGELSFTKVMMKIKRKMLVI